MKKCRALLVGYTALVVAGVLAQGQAPAPPSGTQTGQAVPSSPPSQRLTVADAEQLALKNNPQISISKLLALAQRQATRAVKSNEYPAAVGNLTAVEPHPGSRITAGGLNNPLIFERGAGGVTIAQLITDFGRTRNLISSSNFTEKSRQESQLATSADIVLATDQAFYRALEAQQLLLVAQQTVNARQATVDQVGALAQAKLKSDLDLSFANVNLAQAKLLLLNAQNGQAEALANLNAVLGFEAQQTYELIETNPTIVPPPQDAEQLVATAFNYRPDLKALEYNQSSAERFSHAEHDLVRPAISALAAVGGTPARDDVLTPWYGAVGINMSIPLFNGFLFSARAKQADYQVLAAKEQVRDLRDRIARDVRITWLQANTTYERISVAQQLLNQANLALDLANTRYKLGLGSIVELSQAQLQQTEAEIGNTNARYDYQIALSQLKFQTGQ